MRAWVLEEYNAPLVQRTVEDPSPGEGDAVIRVKACGVCGTDIKICHGQIPPPIVTLPHVPGHEIAGEVVEVGPRAEGVKPGDRVIAYFYLSCGRCEMCATGRENICTAIKRLGFEYDGGMAELVRVPARNLVRLPGEVDYVHGAILADAVAVPFHAVRELAGLKPGQTALVVGAGGLGLHAVQIARLSGARVIAADLDGRRLELARSLGADEVINVATADPRQEVSRLTEGLGPDAVIEVVGSPESLGWSLPSLKRGGTLVIVGYTPGRPFLLDTMAMHYNEWRVVGSRVSTRHELETVVSLVAAGRIAPQVAAVFPWSEANRALAEVEKGEILGRAVLLMD